MGAGLSYIQAVKIMDETQLIKRIISRMLRDPNGLPIGLELLNHDICFLDLPEDIPAFKNADTIYLNRSSRFIQTRDMEESVTFLLLHEAMHTLFFHDQRLKSKEPALWGMATDYMADSLIVYLNDFFKKDLVKYDPDSMFSGEEPFLYDPRYRDMLEEDIYDELSKTSEVVSRITKEMLSDAENKNKKSSNQTGGMPRVIQSRIRLRNNVLKRNDVEVKSNTGSLNSNTKDRFGEEDGDKEKGIQKDVDGKLKVVPDLIEEKQKFKKNMARHTSLARHMFEEILRGHGTTASKRFLESLAGVKTDWKRILKDSLNRALDRSADLTWGKPRLSWLVNKNYLPYLPDYADEPKPGTVIVSIDESASVGDHDVSMAIDIICQAKNMYKKIYVIKHDTHVNWTKEYESIGNAEKKALLKRRHGGGTSHKQVFEKVMQYIKTGNGEETSVYIGITDMDSDIRNVQKLLAPWMPRIYLTRNKSLPKGIIGKVINFY